MDHLNEPTPLSTASQRFARRHIGMSPEDQGKALAELGFENLEALIDAAVPAAIRTITELDLPAAASESDVARLLRDRAALNTPALSLIGLGYHPTIKPDVIRRNVLESPAWYTAYTPYQPEISQGRLEALLNFQTVVGDLTAFPTSNASLLDEATAVVEAVMLMRRATRSSAPRVLVDHDLFPQTLAVLEARMRAVGVDVVGIDVEMGLPDGDFFGLVLSYPGSSGEVHDLAPIVTAAQHRGAMVTMASDLLGRTLLGPPGELGADIAVGATQRCGVPMFFGGPHAAYIAVRDGLERHLPGRLVGVSIDASGRPAYRLALQTREQHIRREKATSNICTAQVLLAVVASMYAVYHGAAGLTSIAERVHHQTHEIVESLKAAHVDVVTKRYFDTVVVRVAGRATAVHEAAPAQGLRLRAIDADHVGLSLSEVITDEDVRLVLGVFDAVRLPAAQLADSPLTSSLRRTSAFLTHPVFSDHRSETDMLRYLRRLLDLDFALDKGMIPLGSCTMKLNATVEMEPISLPGFADLHPFAPPQDGAGYLQLIDDLESWLADLTGYAKVSVQPNAGSAGELAGLTAIAAYHRARGDGHRDVCLIPASAHGTNAASAALAGMRVVVVKSNDDGTVDLDDVAAKCEFHAADLAAIMITYPSTHGVYETGISRLCELVHGHGGQVYVDGANLNALLGVAKPGEFGGDVSHLNLHKTFCIPHGGGGPGVGPVAVASHLVPFLPTHPLHPDPLRRDGVEPVSAAPFGSAGILPIPWAYIRLMGADGLVEATRVAVLSANYVAHRLAAHYPVLYTGENGLVAHECILDLRPLTARSGVTVDDVAKSLADYDFHAPTMSFPVPGTLMIEPTESESLAELGRFIDAMIGIRAEIDEIESGRWPVEQSPLRRAPHTATDLVGAWDRPYSREQAVFPTGVGKQARNKYWPPVGRIEQAYGDRHLVCSCPDPTAF